MLIIGICGASASGKSTLAKAIHERLDNSLIITQDCYYFDRAQLPFEERCRINYDDPLSFDHALLLSDMTRLSKDEAIAQKGYDYVNHCRADTNEPVGPTDVAIIEGIHAFYDEALRDKMDFKLYMQVDADVCLLRRVKRDIRKRGREIESIYAQYLESVKPMYDLHIRNYSKHADVIVAGGGKNQAIVDVLVHYIQSGIKTGGIVT